MKSQDYNLFNEFMMFILSLILIISPFINFLIEGKIKHEVLSLSIFILLVVMVISFKKHGNPFEIVIKTALLLLLNAVLILITIFILGIPSSSMLPNLLAGISLISSILLVYNLSDTIETVAFRIFTVVIAVFPIYLYTSSEYAIISDLLKTFNS